MGWMDSKTPLQEASTERPGRGGWGG